MYARTVGLLTALALSLLVALSAASVAGATMLAPWGSDLVATPTLDTANGACDPPYGSFPCTPNDTVPPNPHYAVDTTVWNIGSDPYSAVPVTAPAGGQVTEVRIKGCAVEDTSASSQDSGGTPANDFNIVTDTPKNGQFVNTFTAPNNLMPFCNAQADGSTVSNTTITNFYPTHLCVAAGDYISFHDIGGQVVNNSGGANWYPQGIPMMIIAPEPGWTMDSYVGGDQTMGGEPQANDEGFGTEQGQEVMMQIIEGTGDDAYGQCPGGDAVEGTDNKIVCVQDKTPESGATPCGCYAQYSICSPSAGTQPAVCYYNNKPWTPAGCPGPSSSSSGGSSSGGGSSGSGKSGGTSSSGSSGPPTITKLKLNPPKFHASKGATITYTDSLAATATDTVYRYKKGVRKGKSCLAVKHVPRHAKRCEALVKVMSFTHADHAGGSGYHLGGLKPGSYLLTVRATLNGQTSQTVSAPFTVTKG